MNKFWIIFVLLVQVNAFSQNELNEQLVLDSGLVYGSFSSGMDIHGTSIRNEFWTKFIKGGEITSNQIDRAVSEHSLFNRVGVEWNSQAVVGVFLPSMKNLPFGLSLHYQRLFIGSAQYGESLFELTFKGNQGLLGDTINLEGTQVNYTQLQAFGGGLMHKKTKSWFSIDYVQQDVFQEFSMNNGYVFTSADSMNISVAANADYNQATDLKGIQINAVLNQLLPWVNEKQAYFTFQLRNLGFVSGNVTHYSIDTSVSFNGFNVDDLTLLNQQQSIDWLDTLSISHTTKRELHLLPFSLLIGKSVSAESSAKLQSFFGIRLMPTISYVPKIYIGAQYQLIKNLSAGASVSYGGFGNYRVGTYIRYGTSNLCVGLGTEDVVGLVSKSGFGKQLSVRLACVF